MADIVVLREIAPTARIASDAEIGPYCVIGPDVTIGPGTVLRGRVSVTGHTTIGSHNVIGEGCVLGAAPQDLKFQGGPTLLMIGHRNRFGREVTVHVGTESGGFVTHVGDDNILDDACHVAHDSYVDNHARIGRRTLLAGHIHVQTGAMVDDLTGLHHFVTIGRYARVGRGTPVRRDVPPFTCFASRDHDWAAAPAVRGPNEEGILAARLAPEEEKELRYALRELFADEAVLQTRIEQLVNLGVEGEAAALCEFCQRSLQGVFGRYRESFRGKSPPEASKYLPPERQSDSRGAIS